MGIPLNGLRRFSKLVSILLILLCLMFFSNVGSCEERDFPIGLTMSNKIIIFQGNREKPSYDYNINYSIVDWIDKENQVIEYIEDYDGDVHTNINPLSDVFVDLPGASTFSANSTTWKIGDILTLLGLNYEVHNKIQGCITGGYFEVFLLWNVTQSIDTVIKTMLCYHSPLGILMDYSREISSTDGGSGYEYLDLCLLETNIHEYYPLLNEPQITTSTTSTSQTTTNMHTTIRLSITFRSQLINIDILLSFGIVAESIIIVLIWSSKSEEKPW